MVVLEEEMEEEEEEEEMEEEEEEDEAVSEAEEDEALGVSETGTAAPATKGEARNAASVGRLIINVPGVDRLPATHWQSCVVAVGEDD